METRITSTPRVGRVLSLAAIAGSISAIVNVLLFQIGLTTGAIPGDLIIPNAGEPLSAVPVIIASIFPSLVAGVVLVILNRFTKKPLRIFNSLAVVIFLLSFFSPFSIPNVPMGMVVILELMHIVVTGAVLYIFNRFARS